MVLLGKVLDNIRNNIIIKLAQLIQMFELERTPSSKLCFEKRDDTFYLVLRFNIYLLPRQEKWFYSPSLTNF